MMIWSTRPRTLNRQERRSASAFFTITDSPSVIDKAHLGDEREHFAGDARISRISEFSFIGAARQSARGTAPRSDGASPCRVVAAGEPYLHNLVVFNRRMRPLEELKYLPVVS
jgi:hypothetical protein